MLTVQALNLSDSDDEPIEVEPDDDFFDTQEEMPSTRRLEPLSMYHEDFNNFVLFIVLCNDIVF